MQCDFEGFSSNFLKSSQDLEGTAKVSNGYVQTRGPAVPDLDGVYLSLFLDGSPSECTVRFLIAVAVLVLSSCFSGCMSFTTCCCLLVSFFFTSVPSYLSSAISFLDWLQNRTEYIFGNLLYLLTRILCSLS